MQGVFEFYRDLPVRPKRPERLFFGLFPDAKTSICVGRFGEWLICKYHLEGARIKTERLHLSLHHVGDYERLRDKFIYAAKQAGMAVSMHPFEITFRFIKSFQGAPSINGRPRRRPLVLLGGGDALVELHKVLGTAMEKKWIEGSGAFYATYDVVLRFKADPHAGDRAHPICGQRIRPHSQRAMAHEIQRH